MQALTLKEKYKKEILPQLKEKFNYKNDFEVPRLEKIVLNVGISSDKRDKSYLEMVEDNLAKISGQKPVLVAARKSIAGFKIRQGMPVGMKVTLRKERMDDFFIKLVHIVLPRMRDFRGIPLSNVDESGNLNIGIKEHIIFPEIKMDDVERIHGLQVTVVSTAKNREEGKALFELLGVPFRKK